LKFEIAMIGAFDVNSSTSHPPPSANHDHRDERAVFEPLAGTLGLVERRRRGVDAHFQHLRRHRILTGGRRQQRQQHRNDDQHQRHHHGLPQKDRLGKRDNGGHHGVINAIRFVGLSGAKLRGQPHAAV
jgi:hypothetical protein